MSKKLEPTGLTAEEEDLLDLMDKPSYKPKESWREPPEDSDDELYIPVGKYVYKFIPRKLQPNDKIEYDGVHLDWVLADDQKPKLLQDVSEAVPFWDDYVASTGNVYDLYSQDPDWYDPDEDLTEDCEEIGVEGIEEPKKKKRRI